MLENSKLTYGVIDYYIEEEELDIRNSINELLSTYMIQASSGEYIMNDMSREYISLRYPPNNEFVKSVFSKRKTLKNMLQQVKVYSEQAPFNPNTVSSKLSDVDKQLATYHLRNALTYGKEKCWNECQVSINKAISIEPDFFEVFFESEPLVGGLIAVVGRINGFERPPYREVVFAILVVEDIPSAERSLTEIVDKLFLPRGEAVEIGHLIAQHVDVVESVDVPLEVLRLRILCVAVGSATGGQ